MLARRPSFGSRGRAPAAGALAIALLLTGCKEELFNALDARDVRDAQLLLEQSGISVAVATQKDGGYALSVEGGDRARALQILADAGLPRTPHSSVVDVFPADGFLVTPLEQKARMAYAVEQELAETLTAIEGVAAARVHVVLPEDNGRGLVKEKARASALLQYRRGADTAALEAQARALLVNGVRGLDYEDISVVLSPWAAGLAAETSAPPAAPAAAEATIGGALGERVLSRPVLTAASVVLAIAAGLLLLAPRRKEG